jgi:hypothetical protein
MGRRAGLFQEPDVAGMKQIIAAAPSCDLALA